MGKLLNFPAPVDFERAATELGYLEEVIVENTFLNDGKLNETIDKLPEDAAGIMRAILREAHIHGQRQGSRFTAYVAIAGYRDKEKTAASYKDAVIGALKDVLGYK